MREMDRRVGPNPMLRSAEAYRCASSHKRSSGAAPSLQSPRSKAMRQMTDTTASTTSDGKPASYMMVTGLPFGGSLNSSLSTSAMVSPPTLALSNMKE